MEPMPGVRTASIGVWVNAGSIAENASEAGATHFIEHLNFKGTPTRSAKAISQDMDSVGGNINAFTAKDCTCFYAQVLGEYLPTAVDVLSDIVLHSDFPSEELEKERHVVVEEIYMNDDSPEDVSSENATAMYFDGDPIALPILGTRDSILSMSRDTLLDYRDRHYCGEELVVSVAGCFDPVAATELISKAFAGARPGACAHSTAVPVRKGGRKCGFYEKDAEQIHITLGLQGCPRDDDRKYALSVLSAVLGGSMSSRLFQTIREERGLCYSVYSYGMSYRHNGALMLYAGTSAKNAPTVLSLMLEELGKLRKDGITKEEFERTKRQLRGNYLMGLESTQAHMNVIGKTLLLQNREYLVDDVLTKMECVTMDDILGIIPAVCDESQIVAAFAGKTAGVQKEIERVFG
ncbi:MAG: pitrilysin family protein [Clostridia bacterium]|nr:pitrilysin family protein [Clostridia bacterium]